jgi:hypothetical protein
VQREILETANSQHLRVYAVWVPFLGATEQAANLSQTVLPDRRVIQFWDESALTSDWFAKNVDNTPFPSWDTYYLYGPNARWETTPQPLINSGGTIIGQGAALKDATVPLLNAE